MPPISSELARHWTLDPRVDFLNHGSFGACPRPVLALQAELRDRMEREPCVFLLHELEGRLDEARSAVAQFLGARSEDMAFVSNTTQGLNAVLSSLRFQPGDELLAIPRHVCPTSALHKFAYIVQQGRVEGTWQVAARDRVLTV